MKAIIHRKPTGAEKEIVASVMKQVEDQMQQEQNKAILRTVKMACIVLNEEFGFGAKRLSTFFEAMCQKGKAAVDNPEGWFLVDEKLHKMGMELDDEDIDEREKHSRSIYHEKGRKFREYN